MIEGNAPRLWDPLSAWPKARIWLWAVLAVLTVITRGPDFADGLRPAKTEGIDFFQEWASARNAMNGLPVYADLRESARLYLGYTPSPGEKTLITRNAHPPTSVVVALPFSRLDYPQATLAWNLASLLALMISLWLIARAERLRCEWWVVFPVVTLALLCDPLQQQVNQGQLNLLLLLLLTLTWTADRSGRSRWAGVFLGLASAIKLFPALFFVYYVLRRRWPVVATGALTLILATAGTLALLGLDAYRSYAYEVMPEVNAFSNWWANVSLNGFWTMWFDSGAVSPLPDATLPAYWPPLMRSPPGARAGLIASTVIVLALWARTVLRAQSPRELDLAFGLTIAAMLLVSPIAWAHYFLLLLLPLLHLWIGYSGHRRMRLLPLLLVICIWASPVTVWTAFLPESAERGTALLALPVICFQFFALLGVFLLDVMLCRRQRLSA